MAKVKERKLKRSAPTAAPVAAAPPPAPLKQPGLLLECALVAGALALFLVIAITSVRQKNSTFDEGTHIPAAYTYAQLGDFRLNPEHPPLVKLLAGLPLRFLHPKMDFNDADWKAAKQWQFGLKFLYEWNDPDRIIFWARVPVMLLALLLGLAVWHCARAFYGWLAGYCALLLCLFNPDVIAHGQLVTTDLAVASFLFLAVYAFYRALQRLTIWRGLLVALVVGLSLVAKFSGILVFLMLALVGAVFAWSGAAIKLALPKAGARAITTRKGKLIAAGALLLATVPVALTIVWACYGFRYRFATDPALSATINWEHYWQKETMGTLFIQLLHALRLVPEGYSYGFLFALESVEQRPAYLMGEYSVNGWWFYFIVTFLIKTPLALLALLALGVYFFRRYGAGMAAEGMLLAPIGLYWLVTLGSNLNIGHRHLLPVYPFLFVFAAKMARVFEPPRPRRLAIACGLLLAWYVAGTLLVYPHFLAYFNEAAGGPARGHHWLADSNLDWGQDLKALAEYRRAHPDEPFYLSYFGTAPPEYYGIQAQTLPGYSPQVAEKMRRKEVVRFDDVPAGATVAISATNLSGVYIRNLRQPGTEQFLQRLRQLDPVAKIGYTIFVYRLP